MSVRQVDIWRMVDVTLGVAILVIAIARLGEQVGPDRALGFGILLFAGLAII